jgi:SAM-dependent methyltransferase
LLDFGCGTGLDAVHYAGKGYRVLAFDNSPGMVARLRSRAQVEIHGGTITAWSASYPSFLANLPRVPRPSAVTANFAVLNSIRDLEPLFDAFADYLAPPGWVIVSILNPLHWLKLKTPGWWLRAIREGNGSPLYAAQPHATYLHSVTALLRAAPRFHLVGRANSGRFVRYDEAATGKSRWWQADPKPPLPERLLWRMPLRRVLGHFVFLILRRDV